MKVYVLTHGTSDPDYGFNSDEVRVFTSQEKARKVLAEMLKRDKTAMAEGYEEEIYFVVDKPDKYFVEGDRRDALKAFIEEIELESEEEDM